ncbi:MAG: diaminopimelate epimerase [Clostridia bacterium]|nr:diaminopimelate epimerase [Clostridia bacterium]
MKIYFTKMHGCGNDYVYVNCFEKELENPEETAVAVSPRHFSVGSDGLILVCRSDIADAKMRMFNADGSEGRMCGNGIRCVGKFVYDNGLCKKTELDIETLSGVKHLSLKLDEKGEVELVTVDMGRAEIIQKGLIVNVQGADYAMTRVSVGNPHAVTFVEDVKGLDLEKIGPLFENNKAFGERVNTEFVRVIDENTLEMRVWERGSGETFACGTGACATVAAAIANGYCRFSEPVTVKLLGGDLTITVDGDMNVLMTGEAVKAYEGVFEYER